MIVASLPHRRPLPLGAEAVARAISASALGMGVAQRCGRCRRGDGHPVDWLPRELVDETVDDLRVRLSILRGVA